MFDGLSVGDIVFYAFIDFDGAGIYKARIKEAHEDYVVAETLNGLFDNLWLDKDSKYFTTHDKAVAYVRSEGTGTGFYRDE